MSGLTAIDLFAGAGGWTAGAAAAGVKVLLAANHWAAAIEAHSRNHPATQHVCQDLCQADFTQFPRHDIMLASPACQGHSKARGKDRPHHDACRSTAWAVIACAEVHLPSLIVVENVPEFLNWKLFAAWRQALQALGYAVSENVLNAADFGVPQHRCRAFVVCTRSRHPLKLSAPVASHVSASTVLDLSSGRWSAVMGHCAATIARIEEGRRQFGERFLIAYYSNEGGGRSLDKPLGTVTTRDRFALIDGDRMRMLTIPEYRRAMGFPESYWLPAKHSVALKLLGNAVPPPLAAGVLNLVKRVA